LKESGRCPEAIPHFRRAAKLSGSTGQKSRIEGISLGAIGTCLGRGGQLDEAEAKLRESVAVLDEVGDVLFVAQYRLELAIVVFHRGKHREALATARHAVEQLEGRPAPAAELAKQITEWIAHPK
jgi:tetratricopeptide (TPR) repeat protein